MKATLILSFLMLPIRLGRADVAKALTSGEPTPPPPSHTKDPPTHIHTQTHPHTKHTILREPFFEKTAQYSARNGTFTEISTWFWSLI